jgi:glycosyltransferase involved in cell wall biosynthesis
MKIGFLLGNIDSQGGISRVTRILGHELTLNGHEIVIINYHANNEVISENIYETYILNDSFKPMRKSLFDSTAKQINRIAKESRIDKLIICGVLFFLIGSLLKVRYRQRVIFWEHANALNKDGFRFQIISRFIAARVSPIVTLSIDDSKDYIKHFRPREIHVINNPIDPIINSDKNKYRAKEKKIITVARLVKQKNIFSLIDIAYKVLSIHKDWTWDIYGDGDLRQELEAYIHIKGLENRVRLIGFVSDLYSLYNHYSIMALTSSYEGFPMSLLEGLAFGLPIISYDIKCGPSEIIADYYNGFLVEFEDRISYESKLMELMRNEILREFFSIHSYKKSENFSHIRFTNSWVNVLSGLS